MSHIRITRTHALGREAALTAANRVADDLRDEHGLKTHWEGSTLVVRGAGVKGILVVSDGSVEVNVKLRLAMWPLRRVLEKEINSHLDEHLFDRR